MEQNVAVLNQHVEINDRLRLKKKTSKMLPY